MVEKFHYRFDVVLTALRSFDERELGIVAENIRHAIVSFDRHNEGLVGSPDYSVLDVSVKTPDAIPNMLDVHGAQIVQVQIRQDGEVMWVNIDGVCRFRVCKIAGHITLDDSRETHDSMGNPLDGGPP